jgi:NADPH-dependent 2,4-dienoyl-CoA reductase/sulfur reductase-like enzyme
MDSRGQACGVLVVGAGPAGLAAAYRAAQAGLRVAVVDDNPDIGGQIWRREKEEQREPRAPEAQAWFQRLRGVDIEFHSGARVFQQSGPGVLLAEMSGGVRELFYNTLVLATGARERFLPFPGWTLPNVMGAGGLQALVKNGLPIEGKKVVIAGSGPLLLAVAGYLRAHGAEILLIAEQASSLRLAKFGLGLVKYGGKTSQVFALRRQLKGVRYLTDCWVAGADGHEELEHVTLQRAGKRWRVACDYLACGFHLVPNLELAELLAERAKQRQFADLLNRTFALRDELKTLATPDTIVCRCEDVVFDRLRAHDSWRAAKLLTRCGMGPCQGRICGSAVEFLFGWTAESVRPPILPVRVESLSHKKAQKST